ncbi:uncharacterized protein LOC109814398 [Cajanus cajan]|uniref:uncharacterized protein LOC109814398 n=1 Tax=Cajanus cajan TaxID=3821 RepID=UPI00098DB8D9|nr:uncharacterized protein LOC109814398 [Cajanus cajan]
MYDGVGNEEDKCVKFVSGLRPEIKQVFNYQGITQYYELVNKCRVYDEDNHARVTHYKSGGPMKNHNKFGSSSKGKPYTKSVGDSSSKVNNQGSVQQRSQAPMASQTSRGGSVGSVPRKNCFKCGKPGHRAYECWVPRVITCYNCQEKGHKAHECPKNKKGTKEVGGSASKPRATGRVFALSGAEATQSADLIQGMDWLSSNHVLLNCADKSIVFGEPIEKVSKDFLIANQVKVSLQEDPQVYMLLASLNSDSNVLVNELPVVCDFSNVFSDDMSTLPPTRKVEFSLDLVTGIGPISIAPYRMSPVELVELKKQIEDLLEKGFVRPSVSPLPIPQQIWSDVAMDFTTKLPNSHGFSTIMVFMDRLSKFGHFIPLKAEFNRRLVA